MMCYTVITSLLADTESMEVRMAASEALMSVATLLDLDDLASHVLTIVIQLAGNDSVEELRITGAELLNMLSPTLCKEEVCRQFITPTVQNLAEDGAFRVRMAVGRNVANIFRTSSVEDISERLLPAFFNLTEDEIWGVRKACAVSLWQIAQVLPEDLRVNQNSIGKRRETLTKVYRRFVTSDPSKWVRNTAFQYLGQFLTVMGGGCQDMQVEYKNGKMASMTFSPSKIIVVNGKNNSDHSNVTKKSNRNKSSKSPRSPKRNASNNNNKEIPEGGSRTEYPTSGNSGGDGESHQNSTIVTDVKNETVIKTLSPLSHYRQKSSKRSVNAVDENLLSVYQSMAYPDSSDRISPPLERAMPTLGSFRKLENSKLEFNHDHQRSSISSGLTKGSDGKEYYNRQRSSSMDFESGGSASDPHPDPDDLAMFCAYSLPGVAYVLGPDKWDKSLRRVFLTLVENPQQRVRRTLAYSLHRLAQILGPENPRKSCWMRLIHYCMM